MIGAARRERVGRLVAATLAGAWRASPPPLDLSAEALATVAPVLGSSSAGGLGWWRARGSARAGAMLELREAYRRQSLEAAVHEVRICEVLTQLRAVGVEPILVKGWAVARLYPAPGLRPYDDIDLCVRPDQLTLAHRTLGIAPGEVHEIDLHRGFARLDPLGFDALYARSELVPLGDLDVRVLGWEDHLCVIATHMLRHGAWSPIWLCDIAVMLEARPPGVDWGRVLDLDPRRARAAAGAVGLAQRLLGARAEDTPFASSGPGLPRWVVRLVLTKWSRPLVHVHKPAIRPLASYLRDPRGLAGGLAARWPDPIRATLRAGGSFTRRTPLPYQVAGLAERLRRKLAGRAAVDHDGAWRRVGPIS